VTEFLLVLPVLLFSVVAHEYAHAWTAYRQGDPTAFQLGRLTLNPVPHLDPIMSVLVPVGLWFLSGQRFTFGAAKPVPVNPRNFRRFVLGDILVSSAGVVMNLLLAALCAGLFVVVGLAASGAGGLTLSVSGTLQVMAQMGVKLNVLLALFNLIPIPPLDGSHLLYHALPARWGARYREAGRYGLAVLMLALMVPDTGRVLLWPVGAVNELAETALLPYRLPTGP
jgi:Zn-dependent protease